MPQRTLVTTLSILALVGGLAIPLAGPAQAQPCAAGSGSSGSSGSGLSAGSSGSTDIGSGSDLSTGSAGSAGAPGHGRGQARDQGPLPVLNGNTQTIEWVTGPRSPNHTDTRFGISGTDLGIAWDNGGVGAQRQVLLAFGDSFGDCGTETQEWRNNVLLRSTDENLADGIDILDPQYGNPYAGSPVEADRPNFSRQIIASLNLYPETTIIPTAGVSVGTTQYINYMSVRTWDTPGRWTTNFSAIATSPDNGETWTTEPGTIRVNEPLDVLAAFQQTSPGNENFQMQAYLRRDGFVYGFGTPNGRFGAARVSRVPEAQILDLNAYTYWNGSAWVPDVLNAVDVIGAPVSEMSAAWSQYLGRYVALFVNEPAAQVEMWTSSAPEGPWSFGRVLFNGAQMLGGFYAPFIHPWSDGNWLYFTLSRWSDYNVMLVRTDLDALR
ncbi:DUF4185 domain-containing protein [Aldersonia sp. NBC_00410]|uniref:DUF4185 domain-containing protein n=1 Tax=Aldersonia sp. NBC_00410 TaxID=2975954 RepID=UPI0022529544|nr:DUF4185 domain-containing protein [Aldersonia sp. NBC_00410]MCX5043089.1 DUF4185 domain-containing protein [Aldersonia sp. NBC_00410]